MLRDRFGGQLGRREVPDALRQVARDLAKNIEDDRAPLLLLQHARSLSLTALGTTGIVGAEDPAPATWGRLGLAPEGIGYTASEWRRIARRVAAAAVRDTGNLPRPVDYLPVASAQDAPSARCFGDEFARAGLPTIAIAFGSLTSDSKFAASLADGQRRIMLPRPLPMSHVNSITVLLHLLHSYTLRAGHPPNHVHLLGLGSPILIGLAALACAEVPLVTVDATSPIRDAMVGTLYSNRPTLMKLNPNKIAERILTDRRRTGSTCPCGACKRFHQYFPQDAVAARTAWAAAGAPIDVSPHLVEGSPLGDALPLLSISRPLSLRGPAARAARMRHNHWSLTRLCEDLTNHMRRDTLNDHIDHVIDLYTASASSPYAAAAAWARDQIRNWPPS